MPTSHYTFEPVHDKTKNKTYINSKDLDQPVHPPSMARVLVYSSLDSTEADEGTRTVKTDQTTQTSRLI